MPAPTTIITVQGELVPVPGNELFLALWLDSGKFWQVSGVIYRTPAEVESNLSAFHPQRIVIVKIPMRALD